MSREQAMAPIAIETRTIRKLKIRILPFILLLYIVSFLDRINISFAKLTMDQDLAITSHQFGLAVGIFFIGYSLFEIPSNLLLHKIGARIWLARILIIWGIISTLTGLVQNVQQLYLARFLLGWAEAGYFPGIILYLTYWFRRREQAQVLALLLIGIPITSILGAPLSGLILDHAHWLGLGSWRWLLILEGIPALVGGVLTYYLLPSRPAEARFLAEDEKAWIIQELEREGKEKRRAHSVSAAGALVHGRVWYLACIAFALGTALYIASFWLPQIVKALSSSVFQYRSRTSGDGAERCRVGVYDCHFPEFRPQAGAEMARRNSRICRGNCLPAVRRNSFRLSLYCAPVSNISWYLRCSGAILGPSLRVPDWFLGSFWDCVSYLDSKSRWICRTVRSRSDSAKNR